MFVFVCFWAVGCVCFVTVFPSLLVKDFIIKCRRADGGGTDACF